MSGPWLDIHCHFVMFEEAPSEVLARAADNGVIGAIDIATNARDIHAVFARASQHNPRLFCALGIHPHDAADWSPEIHAFIRENAQQAPVACLGEMGLDYYYQHSEPQLQQRVFREQLQIALDFDLPIQIHTRDAEEDTIAILRDMGGRFRGVIHCFTGSPWLAEQAMDIGLNLSISGIATFKNAQELRDTLARVPIERMHVETDAPFLTPVPKRGQKNEPAYVMHTAEFMAAFKSVSLEDFCKQMTKNNLQVFPKLQQTYDAWRQVKA